MAAVDLSAGATVGAAYDTNIYQLSSIEPAPLVAGERDRSDMSRQISAFAAAAFGASGPLNLQLNANYSQVESGTSSGLDRGDYNFGGNLDWKPSRVFDLSLAASQNRLPLGLADVGGTEATQQSSRTATGTLHIRPTPRWQVGLSPGWNEVRTPLPDAEDFRWVEKSAGVSLEYLAARRVVPGISATRKWARNSQIENATRYREHTIQGTLGYAATSRSTFSLAAGYTQRRTSLVVPSTDPLVQELEGTNSAFTGSLNFNRQISVKTGVYVSAYRYLEQYDAGVNPSVGTGLSVGANWAPTAKIALNLDSAVIWSSIEAVTPLTGDRKRNDMMRNLSLGMVYTATRMVSLRTYVTRTIRRSEVWTDQYNSTVAGVELTARID